MNASVESKYRPDIDGLRAIAVMSVVIFHFFPSLLPGGFVGVDVFFVISGYLITGIIIEDLNEGSFTIRGFYERRIRRIFPALTLVLAGVFLFGWATLLSDEFQRLGKHLMAGAGFLSNFALWSEAGYFDTGEALKPLLHLWSLGVEEQFYILWPPMLVAINRLGLRRDRAILSLLALSFCGSVYLAHTEATAAFYSPLSRFWEILLGAYLAQKASLGEKAPFSSNDYYCFVGIALIIVGIVFIDKTKAFPGFWAMLPALGTYLLISSGAAGSVNKNLLSNKYMVWVGLISYPLYLWHWPLLSFAHIVRGKTPTIGFRLTLIFVSTALAAATYKYLERKIRKSPAKTHTKPLAAAMAVLLALGAATFFSEIPPRNSDPRLEKIVKAVQDWSYPDGLEKFPFKESTFYKMEGTGGAALFIGDSHVEQYGPRIAAMGLLPTEGMKTVYFATSGGCPPIDGLLNSKEHDQNRKCIEARTDAFELAASPDIDTIVLGGCWNCYLKTDSNYVIRKEGRDVSLQTSEGEKLLLIELERKIKEFGVGKKVYLLLGNPISSEFDPKNQFEGTRLRGLSVKTEPVPVRLDPHQERIRSKLNELGNRLGIPVIDPVPFFCPNGECITVSADGRPIYKDETHFRPFFVKEYCGFIDQAALVNTP